MEPLAGLIAAGQPEWTVQSLLAEDATKRRLTRSWGARRPALLFTASHGMGFPTGDPRQCPHQGALLCQDWPGPKEWRGRARRTSIFRLTTLALTPECIRAGFLSLRLLRCGHAAPDDFAQRALGERRAIAPHAFVASLPKKAPGPPAGRRAGSGGPRRTRVGLFVFLARGRATAAGLRECL